MPGEVPGTLETMVKKDKKFPESVRRRIPTLAAMWWVAIHVHIGALGQGSQPERVPIWRQYRNLCAGRWRTWPGDDRINQKRRL